MSRRIQANQSSTRTVSLRLGKKPIGMLLEQEHLVVQDADIVTAAVTQYSSGLGSDFADCMILEVARSAGHLLLATFDRKLAKAEGAQRLR